jgi:hypothetical protein
MDPANTRFQSQKDTGLNATQVAKLKLRWAFGLPVQAVETLHFESDMAVEQFWDAHEFYANAGISAGRFEVEDLARERLAGLLRF